MLILHRNTGFYSALGHTLSYSVLTRKRIATQTCGNTLQSRVHITHDLSLGEINRSLHCTVFSFYLYYDVQTKPPLLRVGTEALANRIRKYQRVPNGFNTRYTLPVSCTLSHNSHMTTILQPYWNGIQNMYKNHIPYIFA